jgi:two-component system cell cycle response regulator
LVIDRSDELGELSRLLRDLTVEVIENRRQARWLRKCMGDNIRRETDKATAQLQRQVNTDPLTGLGNRRTMEQRLEELTADAATSSRLLTVVAIDLDHFKVINDLLGHEAGDQCLAFLADLLLANLRPQDSAIRLGGDEFIVLLPEMPVEQARGLAERFRSLHAQMVWPHRQVPRPTLSIGLSCAQTGSLTNPLDLVREADAALYESKRHGRARTTVFGGIRAAA